MLIKKIIAFTLMAIGIFNTSLSQKSGNEFVLKGKLIGQNDGMIYLYYSDRENTRIKDSSGVKNGGIIEVYHSIVLPN